MHFVLGAKDDPGEVGIASQGVDHHAFNLDVEGGEDIANQFVSERSFVVLALHRHRDGFSHARFNMDDKALLIISDVDGQRMLIRGKNPKYFHAHDIRVHTLSVPLPGTDDNDGTDDDDFLISRRTRSAEIGFYDR